MCRLYLYTTLKINEILAVVYHTQNVENSPGKDSAQKKLKELLDKEYRWLKPADENDMSRRYAQLLQSPTRSNPQISSIMTRPSSRSDPPPYSSNSSPAPIKSEREVHSATLENMPEYSWSHSSTPNLALGSPSANLSVPGAGEQYAGSSRRRSSASPGTNLHPAMYLERQGSVMSTSTNQTTGSFNRLLPDYSESYVDSVRKLVKRYTAPLGSSTLERMVPQSTVWYNDVDAPSCQPGRPFPLPGDFLTLDVHLQQQGPCFPQSEEHNYRWCLCHVLAEIPEQSWVMSQGPTPFAHQLLTAGLPPSQAGYRDAYGNTALHFLAARGFLDPLLNALNAQPMSAVANAKNSVGQTFVHVLPPSLLGDLDATCRLLDFLLNKVFPDGQRFNIGARDDYGRTIFHLLLSLDLSRNALQFLLQRYGGVFHAPRDAFNLMLVGQEPIPYDPSHHATSQRSSPESSDSEREISPGAEPYYKEARLLELARNALDKPKKEDSEGRNGLHCLAMASLSKATAVNKAEQSNRNSPPRLRRRVQTVHGIIDSSIDRLNFRHKLVAELLSSGVDPNHYDSNGNTPLMAFTAELPEDDDYKTGPMILDLLLKNGADVNARNRGGETALHIAVRCGRKLAARALIEHGANVHARDAAGRSVLMVADEKMKSAREDDAKEYAHLEACRAYLSGKAGAVQEPTVLQEWGSRSM
ncbi:unnamed protein product [Clonostachys solani]|uniref:Ankyrin repeat protein n=1 Tax=Clonostachys solani TaxID=160281 RepID=A0A9N9ZQH1_9HYPO|nr:unnamed protein product [Clonostachys solani]